MDNPYSPQERSKLGVSFLWDHALYNGHYYMYFGVVPVLLLFLPWRLLTGSSLTTYHATQIFVALYILGVFALFKRIAQIHFRELPISVCIILSCAFSIMSVWYSIDAPAMYCTAITAGLCMQIWSIYFFFKSVWGTHKENKSIIYACVGSIFGALSFGCRPPIALSNILAISFVIVFLKKHSLNLKLAVKMLLAATPYIVVAFLLMKYNYARFENPFEFGQSYQLTEADQTKYIDMVSRIDIKAIWNGIRYFLIGSYGPRGPLSLGAFVTFPILLFIFFGLLNNETRERIASSELNLLSVMLPVTIIMIMSIDVLWTPVLIPRSRLDIYWLLGILDYIIIGFFHHTRRNKARFCFIISTMSIFTIFVCFVLYLYPNDGNFTKWYGYGTNIAARILTFGLLN